MRNFITSGNNRSGAVAAAIAILVLSLTSPASAQSNGGESVGKTLLNAFGDALQDTIRNAPHNAWAKVDLAIQQCLVDTYHIVPGDLVDQGIYPSDPSVRPYIDACQPQPPPSASVEVTASSSIPANDLGSYSQTSPGNYTRTSSGLAEVGSTYILRVRASEAMDASALHLVASVDRKAQFICTGQDSIALFRLYDGKDANASAYGIHEPWIDAQVECSVEKPDPEDAATALMLDTLINTPTTDSTNAMLSGDYFDFHSEQVYAPYDKAFAAVQATLAKLDDPIAVADSNKGVFITANPNQVSGLHHEQFFIALAPKADGTTLITFKLLRSWRDMSRPHEQAFIPEDRDSTNRRASEFIDTVREKILKAKGG